MSGPSPAFSAVRAGFRASLRNPAAAVWSYVLVTLASLPLAFAGGYLIHDRFAATEGATAFATGLDPILGTELFAEEQSAVWMLSALAAGALLVWLFLSTYLAGATISAVSRPEPAKTSDLFSGGGRAIGRLLRLQLFNVPFFAVAAGLPIYGIWTGAEALARDLVSEQGVATLRGLALVFSLAIIGWVGLAHDFMRVEAVARGEHRARYAFVRGLKRAAKSPFSVLVLASSFSGSALLLTILVSLIDVNFSRGSWAATVAGFVLQQLVAFARAGLRVGLAGAEVGYVMGDGGRRSSAIG